MTGLTLAYIAFVAALMLHDADPGTKIGSLIFGEVVFSPPILLSWSLARDLRQPIARSIMLVFTTGYALFSILTYYHIVTGEHDAQWQLSFLLVPMVGIPAVLLFGVSAALVQRLMTRPH